jgi:two-component system, NarL family, sensor histidine kinase NreB
VRNLSLDLRPAMLDDFGLFAVLEWLFQRYTKQTHLAVNHDFSFLDERRFPKVIETAVFRIIQEVISNPARYAGVQEVEVKIQVNDCLEVEIRDQGKGFDASHIDISAYQTGGLSGMRARWRLIGPISAPS